jgi:hypothetical protein
MLPETNFCLFILQVIPLCAGTLSGGGSFCMCAVLSWLATIVFVCFSGGIDDFKVTYGAAERTDGAKGAQREPNMSSGASMVGNQQRSSLV